MSTLSKISVGVVLGVVIAALLVPYFRARNTSSMNACVNNLRQLDGAKQTWALEHRKSFNEVPTLEDLRPYLKEPLVCPQRGVYIVGRVSEIPKCSLGGSHALPQ